MFWQLMTSPTWGSSLGTKAGLLKLTSEEASGWPTGLTGAGRACRPHSCHRKTPVKITYNATHRLIIPRWSKCSVFLDSWTFCCPVLYRLSAFYCTLPTPDPARLAWHRSTRCTISIALNGRANCTVVESWFNSHRRRVAPPPLFPTRYD